MAAAPASNPVILQPDEFAVFPDRSPLPGEIG